jgi:hypothetical protein
MTKRFLMDTFGWGFFLWLIGYILGIILFLILPATLIGWVIMPIGIALTLWVLLKKVHAESLKNYVFIAIAWGLIAITCDYIFLVKLFKPVDGYYKLDVYVYYIATFTLPLLIGWIKTANKKLI